MNQLNETKSMINYFKSNLKTNSPLTSFQRHKKMIRTAQSAFMERAHNSLHEKWDRRKQGLPPLNHYEMPQPPSNFVKVM